MRILPRTPEVKTFFFSLTLISVSDELRFYTVNASKGV